MTFKELHEAYHRPVPICGVYQIKNLITGKSYIGKSKDVHKRWTQHCLPSTWEKEPNKPLYRAMKRFGVENFEFTIIEECPRENLALAEKYWIAKLKTQEYDIGYNITSGGEDGFEGAEHHPNHKLTHEDIVDIRTRYAKHERCIEVEELYADKIGHSGFAKVWKGETWHDIMPEVYTEENKAFHKNNTGCPGSKNGRAILNEDMVYDIRLRKKNGEHWRQVYEAYRYTGISIGSFKAVWFYNNWKQIVV